VLRFAELQAEYMYNTFGINKNTIARVGIPNGDAHVHSITVNPVVHLPVPGRLGAYATGGVGWYHRIVEATRPVAVTTIFFDPFFGFIPGVVGANQVIASRSRDAVGYNIGAGLTYKLSGPAQLYVESRYHHAFTAHGDTEMLPITIGLRF
jgi:opacity protein-like surface antigen